MGVNDSIVTIFSGADYFYHLIRAAFGKHLPCGNYWPALCNISAKDEIRPESANILSPLLVCQMGI